MAGKNPVTASGAAELPDLASYDQFVVSISGGNDFMPRCTTPSWRPAQPEYMTVFAGLGPMMSGPALPRPPPGTGRSHRAGRAGAAGAASGCWSCPAYRTVAIRCRARNTSATVRPAATTVRPMTTHVRQAS
jgi:hypothetical protein